MYKAYRKRIIGHLAGHLYTCHITHPRLRCSLRLDTADHQSAFSALWDDNGAYPGKRAVRPVCEPPETRIFTFGRIKTWFMAGGILYATRSVYLLTDCRSMTDPQAPKKPLPPVLQEAQAWESQNAGLPDVDVDDRGPAQYFHGRERVRIRFANLCAQAREQRGGTIFLIQGAPGAGKTALLHKLAEEAKSERWNVARIHPRALHDPARMAECLGLSYTPLTQKHWGIDLKVVIAGKTREVRGVSTASQVLRQASTPERGVVLLLDESQNILGLAEGPHELDANSTLNAIHNGELNRPVILLAGGLSTSEAVFGRLGISRFRAGNRVNLGRLSPPSERSVIHDWLVKDGGAAGDVTPWIDTIAGKTDGWPQHIVSFTQPAAHVLRHRNGIMTQNGLAWVLEQGEVKKDDYYTGRVVGIARKHRIALSQILQGREATLEEDEVLELLGETTAPHKVQEVFDTILHKGVLAWTPEGALAVPIPSMEDWLVRTYAPEKKRGLAP